MHPYILHPTLQNVIRHGELITNQPSTLREPLQFGREDARSFSAVELAVLRGLGVDHLRFQPAGERGTVVSRGSSV